MGYHRRASLTALRAVGEGSVVGHQSKIGCDTVCVRNAVAYMCDRDGTGTARR